MYYCGEKRRLQSLPKHRVYSLVDEQNRGGRRKMIIYMWHVLLACSQHLLKPLLQGEILL
jgi:hypothetical protein